MYEILEGVRFYEEKTMKKLTSSFRKTDESEKKNETEMLIPLTPRDIEDISKHEGRVFKFDFSQINEKTFDSLLLFFRDEFKFGFEGLGFNNDFLVESMRRIEREQIENPYEDTDVSVSYKLDHSVAKTRKEFLSQLVENLGILMEKSETLSFIKFRFLPLQQHEIDILTNACFNCAALRVFRLCDVTLGDKQFSKLCRALCKSNIEDVQFRKCCLTDACANDVNMFLSFHAFSKSGVQWGNKMSPKSKKQRSKSLNYLKNIDLRENYFTEEFINAIFNELLELAPDSIDFRGNTAITDTLEIRRMKKLLRNTKVLIGATSLPKAKLYPTKIIEEDTLDASQTEVSLSKSLPLQTTFKSTSKKSERIAELEEENLRLADLIDELQKKENIVMLEPDLMIVGNQANEFADRIRKLDLLFCQTQNGPKPFLKAYKGIHEARFKFEAPRPKPKKLKKPKAKKTKK